MSLETEIGRLADVLEKIEAKMPGDDRIVNVDLGEPEKAGKKKKKKATEAVTETVTAGGEERTPEEETTPEEFLKYANGELLAMKDVAKRTAVIAKVKNMLKKEYNVTSIKAVPAESIAECKTKFDLLIGA